LSYTFNGHTNTTGVFSGVAAGTSLAYSITDANSCGPLTGTINVTQPTPLVATAATNNAFLYYGYTGDQTATITGSASGGVGPYTIKISMNRVLLCNQITSSGDELWNPSTPGGVTVTSGGITSCPLSGSPDPSVSGNYPYTQASTVFSSYSINVSLMQNATFTITVTDANGCMASQTVLEQAEDVRCFSGKSGIAKVTMCHYTGSTKNPWVTICVDSSAVPALVALGDKPGPCSTTSGSLPDQRISTAINATKLEAKVLPNPTSSYFTLGLKSASNEKVNLTVVDVLGSVVEQRSDVPANSNLQIGNGYHPGVYFAQLMQGKETIVLKLIKEGQ